MRPTSKAKVVQKGSVDVNSIVRAALFQRDSLNRQHMLIDAAPLQVRAAIFIPKISFRELIDSISRILTIFRIDPAVTNPSSILVVTAG